MGNRRLKLDLAPGADRASGANDAPTVGLKPRSSAHSSGRARGIRLAAWAGADAPAEVRVRGPRPAGDSLVDSSTDARYSRNPNRRILSDTEASGLLNSAAIIKTRNETLRTGKVSVQVVACTELNFLRVQQFGCDVDLVVVVVVVGGGASVTGDEPNAGALLTESRPLNPDLFTWVARLTDRGQLQVVTARSGPVAHPRVTANLSAGFTVPGGGASLPGGSAGGFMCNSLLTNSIPSGNGWLAGGKDHAQSCPSFVVGGEARWGDGKGRLLMELASVGRGARATDKDHLEADNVGVLGVRCIGGACL